MYPQERPCFSALANKFQFHRLHQAHGEPVLSKPGLRMSWGLRVGSLILQIENRGQNNFETTKYKVPRSRK
jgi:hypothetical protein